MPVAYARNSLAFSGAGLSFWESPVPGTVYAFQARAFGTAGYTDFTDSATCMSVLRFVTPDGKELETWDESAPPNRVKK